MLQPRSHRLFARRAPQCSLEFAFSGNFGDNHLAAEGLRRGLQAAHLVIGLGPITVDERTDHASPGQLSANSAKRLAASSMATLKSFDR
jgi:hypothetical protein